jgi:hypothetical protein
MRRPRGPRSLGPVALTLAAIVLVPLDTTQAAFSSAASNSGSTAMAAPDWKPPVFSGLVVQKSQGGTPGYVRQGAQYRLLARVIDDTSSNPPAGVDTVTGEATNLTAAATAVPLPAGAVTVGATTYTHQSALLTVAATKAAAPYALSASARDLAAPANQSAAYAGTVVVDNTAPSALTLTIANGGTIRRPDAGDTVTFVWSEVIDPISILAAWTGSASNVTVRITNGSTGNDVLTVWNSANTAQLPFGSVNLGSGSYVGTTTTFGASSAATRSTMTWTNDRIVVRFGTASATATTNTATGTTVWTPSTTVFDRAGNVSSGATVTETGGADREF